jgi:putative phage-type endonuclease
MNISTKYLGKKEWQTARFSGLGGSDAAAVLGLNPFKTPLDVYTEKVDKVYSDIEDIPRVQAGIRLESAVADWWSQENGFKIQNDNKIRFHKKYPFLLANIDRIIVGNGNGRGTGILEVKCTSSFAQKQWADDGLPFQTYCQIQHYFNVTGHKWGAVAVLIDGFDLQSIDVEPDKEFIELMTDKLCYFWTQNVVKRIPPEPATIEEVKKVYPSSISNSVEATPDTLELWKELKSAKTTLKTLSDQKDLLELQIKNILKNSDTLTFQEQVLCTWKQSKSSMKFDIPAFKKDHEDLFKEYLKETPGSRRFLVKDMQL